MKFNNSSTSATCLITKISETIVDLTITINTDYTTLNGITVTNPSGSVYNISYTNDSGTFTGTIQGAKLDWMMLPEGFKVPVSDHITHFAIRFMESVNNIRSYLNLSAGFVKAALTD